MFDLKGRVAVNDLHAERAQQTVDQIARARGNACAAIFDVTDYDSVVAGIREAETALGPVDILVNNAGVPANMGLRPFRETTPESWRPSIDINLYGVMNCSHAVLAGMIERSSGRIITISSGAGTARLALGVSPYAAGKGGGISFMRHLALESARSDITANTIAVGLMNSQADAAATKHLARTIPVGRLGDPADIGALCVYLASDEAAWMTGQTLQLNGGHPTT